MPAVTPVAVERERIESWKGIAAYFGKYERTVKRWELERGLPIHRLPGKRGGVFAYEDELSAWRNSGAAERSVEADAEESPEPEAALQAELVAKPVVEPEFVVARHSGRWGVARWATVGVGLCALLFAGTHTLARTRRPVSTAVSDADGRQAHELYLKGRYEWNRRTPESLNRALDDFTQAIVHNPQDARSYVGLADTYNLLQIYSTLPLTDSSARAIAAARRAVQLDDTLAEAHRALAFTEFYGTGDYVESEKEFRRAIDLNPDDPVTRRWYGNAFAMPGRYDESLQQFDKAQELDPGSPATLSDKGIVLFDAGRVEEGIATLRDVERADPEFFSAHEYLMLIALERHDFRTFLSEGERAAESRNDDVLRDVMAAARRGWATGGERALLQNVYATEKGYVAQGKVSPGPMALTCVAMGKRQEALDLLREAYFSHRPEGLWILSDPSLRTLRNEPGYKELVSKINFPGVSLEVPPAAPAAEVPLRAAK